MTARPFPVRRRLIAVLLLVALLMAEVTDMGPLFSCRPEEHSAVSRGSTP